MPGSLKEIRNKIYELVSGVEKLKDTDAQLPSMLTTLAEEVNVLNETLEDDTSTSELNLAKGAVHAAVGVYVQFRGKVGPTGSDTIMKLFTATDEALKTIREIQNLEVAPSLSSSLSHLPPPSSSHPPLKHFVSRVLDPQNYVKPKAMKPTPGT